MGLEIDKLENKDWVILVNNTTGEVQALWSVKDAIEYIQNAKPDSKLSDFFDEEEIEIIEGLDEII